jgi:hypothetical protein
MTRIANVVDKVRRGRAMTAVGFGGTAPVDFGGVTMEIESL